MKQDATDRTIEAYNKLSGLYDAETVDFWENFPTDIVNAFSSSLRGKLVADLGSGPGRDAEILRSRGLEIHCIDASGEMVSITRSKGFHSVQADLRSKDLDLTEYFGIWAYSSLIHLKKMDTTALLERISISARSDTMGLFGFIEGNGNEIKSMTGTNQKRFFQYSSLAELEELMENSGVKIIKVFNYRPKNHNYINLLVRF